MSKKLIFLGDSKADLSSFPIEVRKEVGYQIFLIEQGFEPRHWKPMKTVGAGVREIKVVDKQGQFRVFYIASLKSAIFILHSFKKATKTTSQSDISIGKKMFKEAIKRDKESGSH